MISSVYVKRRGKGEAGRGEPLQKFRNYSLYIGAKKYKRRGERQK